LCKTCDSLTCHNFVDRSMQILWKFIESSEIVKHRLSKIIFSTLWIRSSLTTDGQPNTSLFIVNSCSPAHLRIFYTTVLQFLHSLNFGGKPRTIPDGFPLHSCSYSGDGQ
jgi:hypothetical protein